MAEKDYEKGCVLIDRGKIIEVAANIKEMPDCEVIDADNCWVTPGLIDAHSHIGITEKKKKDLREKTATRMWSPLPHI